MLHGRCDERESVPFKALDRAMDELCNHLRGLPAAEADALMPRHIHLLARLFPVLRRVPAVQRAPGLQRETRTDPLEVRRLGSADAVEPTSTSSLNLEPDFSVKP